MIPTLQSLHFPPLDQSLLFPDLINFHMEKNPSHPIFVYANDDVLNTLTEISFLEFGRAAYRVAHALRPSRQGPDGAVVMIIANTDTILYHAVTTGLSIAGWVPFPVSTRNSSAAVVSMMKKTNCSRIVTIDHTHKALIDSVCRELGAAEPTVYELPAFRHVFPKLGQEVAADPFVPYHPMKRPDPDSVAIYIHSSGSTGFPKPIPNSYRIQTQWMAHPSFRLYRELTRPRRVGVMALPSFHAFGIITQLYTPLVHLTTTVVYPPRTYSNPLGQPVIPTSDNMIEVLKQTQSGVLITVPTLLEQMARSDEDIAVLKQLEWVNFGGGPLAAKVGQRLWDAGVQLSNTYGATELGTVATANLLRQDIADGDWMWVRFPDSVKVRWNPQGDDIYELHILSGEGHPVAVENLPDTKGYATSDAFVKHPTKDMWKIVGRTDDVIILASGEKTVPAPMESIILSSSLVQGVVMFGRERDQVGVLIEPRHPIDVTDEKAVIEFRNKIWPVIEEANKPSPAFSRIFKEMILITSKAKPMSRAPKGTVQRKMTLNAYESEIKALYDTVEASADPAPDGLAGPSAWTSNVLEEWLLGHARAISPSGSVDPKADLFAQGFDSLSATYLRNKILGAIRKSLDSNVKKVASQISPNVIFENPTIHLLGAHIAAIVSNDGSATGADFVEQHKGTINAMIEKYSVGLDGPVDGVLPSSQLIEPAVVLLTGSTGGLGSFLLSELLRSPTVQRVFAFNRPCSTKSIAERQMLSFRERGLQVGLLDSSKLVYIEANASQERCGLTPAQYEEIRNSVTLIIHNAWRLDFNMGITSFEDSIRASRNLIDLGLDSPKKQNLRFLFTSSVGSAQGWDISKGPLSEEVQQDPSVAIGAGYGEGKYATERIVVKSGLHATSLRIGQIVGGHNGSWATTDWFPILVKSSITLGVLPEAAGVVSWLREEEVASATLEAAFAKESPPPALNIVNPRSAPWAQIIASVRRSIIKRKALFSNDVLPIVPFGDWFKLLEKKAEVASEDDLAEIPAIKLLGFFRALARGDEAIRTLGVASTEAAGMTNFSTTKAREVCATMANMQAIGEAEADAWVGYWMSKGVF